MATPIRTKAKFGRRLSRHSIDLEAMTLEMVNQQLRNEEDLVFNGPISELTPTTYLEGDVGVVDVLLFCVICGLERC